MASLRSFTLTSLVSVSLIAGCGKVQKEFDRQLEICSAGENNGVLTAASEGCGGALDIARQHNFPPEEISDLTYRLGQIERKRGHFEEAERLLRASLEFESQASDRVVVAGRLVELSFALAGQDRWEEGTTLLERAAPSIRSLDGEERKAASNALRGYAMQLGKQGDPETAARFTALALVLDSPVNEDKGAR